jgi:hypothetical protein
MVMGAVRAPAFTVLFNETQYKQWKWPNIPWKYLSDPKPKAAPSGANLGDPSMSNSRQAPGDAPAGGCGGTNKATAQRLRNLKFQENLRFTGFKICKVATFLENSAPDG